MTLFVGKSDRLRTFGNNKENMIGRFSFIIFLDSNIYIHALVCNSFLFSSIQQLVTESTRLPFHYLEFE